MIIREQFSLDLWPLNLVGWYGYRHFGCSIYLAWSALPVFALMWNICCLCQALKWKCLVCLPRWHFKKSDIKKISFFPASTYDAFHTWLTAASCLSWSSCPMQHLGLLSSAWLGHESAIILRQKLIYGLPNIWQNTKSEWILTMKPGNATSIDIYLPNYVVIHITTHI